MLKLTVGILVALLAPLTLMACGQMDSPQERAIKEWEKERLQEINEWLTEGKCWFRGETLTEVEDRSGSSYSTSPYDQNPRSLGRYNDSCIFEVPRDTSESFEPLEVHWGLWGLISAVRGGEYLFRIEQVNRGGSGNLPESPYEEWRIKECVSRDCSGEPTWEVYRETVN